jgi:hypothetical protein
MGEIRLLGQPQGNPLLILASALTEVTVQLGVANQHLGAIATNTAKENKHVYSLAPMQNGLWGTFCIACSDDAQDYVFPCLVLTDRPTPPSHIGSIDDLDFTVRTPPERPVQDTSLPE